MLSRVSAGEGERPEQASSAVTLALTHFPPRQSHSCARETCSVAPKASLSGSARSLGRVLGGASSSVDAPCLRGAVTAWGGGVVRGNACPPQTKGNVVCISLTHSFWHLRLSVSRVVSEQEHGCALRPDGQRVSEMGGGGLRGHRSICVYRNRRKRDWGCETDGQWRIVRTKRGGKQSGGHRHGEGSGLMASWMTFSLC